MPYSVGSAVSDELSETQEKMIVDAMFSKIEYNINVDRCSMIMPKIDELLMELDRCHSYTVTQETRKRFYALKRRAKACASDNIARELLREARLFTSKGYYEDAKAKLNEASLKAQYTSTQKAVDVAIKKNMNLQIKYLAKIKEDNASLIIENLLHQADIYIDKEQIKEACEVYTSMFEAAGDSQRLRNMVHSNKEKTFESIFWKLKNKTEKLITEGKLDDAKICLKKASDVAHDPILSADHEFITSFNRTKDLVSNEEAKFLQTEALRLAKEENLEQAIIKIDAALKLANEYSTKQSLELDKIKYSKRDKDKKKAKELQETGNKYVKTNEFKEAIVSFDEALNFAHVDSLIQSILTDQINARNKYGKFLQDEANKLVTQNKYEEAYVKFKDAFGEARDAALVESIKKDENEAKNKQIKFLQEVANKLATENKFDDAYQKFDKALQIHGDVSLIKSVKVDKAKAYNLQGSLCLKQAFDLDSKEPYTEQQAKEAREKFNLAKDRFRKADETNHKKEYEQNVQIATYKIYGDDRFNEALSLEDDAYAIYEEAKKTKNEKKYIAAREKFQEVLNAFTEAKWGFEEGLRLNRKEFKDSVKLVSEQITIISKILEGSGMIRMWCAFQNNERLYAEMLKKDLAKNASSS